MVPADSTIRANEQPPVKGASEVGGLMAFPMVRRESRFQGFLLARRPEQSGLTTF